MYNIPPTPANTRPLIEPFRSKQALARTSDPAVADAQSPRAGTGARAPPPSPAFAAPPAPRLLPAKRRGGRGGRSGRGGGLLFCCLRRFGVSPERTFKHHSRRAHAVGGGAHFVGSGSKLGARLLAQRRQQLVVRLHIDHATS